MLINIKSLNREILLRMFEILCNVAVGMSYFCLKISLYVVFCITLSLLNLLAIDRVFK